MRSIPIILAALFLTGLASGCGTSNNIADMSPGEERVVERFPDDTPDWLEIPFEENDDHFYFRGEAARASDPALGMRQAKANAIQALVEATKIKARSEFSEAVRGVNVSESSLGRYLDNVVAWTSENVQITGVFPEGEYREKVQVRTYEGVEYVYNCFNRISIPVENYIRAREAALTRSAVEAEDEDAKALAFEAKEQLSH